jgi:hypothetical protein
VRTMIRIDDDLYRQVKAKAARPVRRVAAVLHDAVRQGISPSEQSSRGRYVLRPTGRGGLRAGVDLSPTAAVSEVIDEGASVDARR